MGDHLGEVQTGLERSSELAATPASQIALKEFTESLQELKDVAKPIEVDLRDAKRRITVAKGPQKKRKAKEEPASEASDGGVSD